MWWTLIGAALAADLTVGPDPGDDYATLDAAAAVAVAGDRILLADATHRTEPVVLDGVQLVGVPGAIVLPYANSVLTDPMITLRGATSMVDVEVRGRDATRVVVVESGEAALTRVLLRSGAGTDGANLWVQQSAAVELVDSTVLAGTASGRGGGMYVQGTATVTGTLFERNAAATGGGLRAAAGATLVVLDSLFLENSAQTAGGGLYSDATGARIERTRFEANTSGGSSAGADVTSPTTLIDCDFLENVGTAHSGLEVRGLPISAPTIARRLRFCDNTVPAATVFSASFRVAGGPVTASNLLFSGPSDAFLATGGAEVELGFATWLDQFAGDGAPGSGLRVEQNSSVDVSNSLLQNLLGQPFFAAGGSSMVVTNVRTHLVGTPPAGSSPADPMFEGLGACGWPVPLNDAVRDALSDPTDPDGTPGALGATGGPFGPPEVYPDGDEDGWGDRREELEGTNPLDPDSDDDGAADSVDPVPLPQPPPTPGDPPAIVYGFGCATGSGGGSAAGWLALALIGSRRRPSR